MTSPFKWPVPIVSAIIERQRDGETEILLQTRWKPDKDPKYSGALEIPAGGIEAFENIYDALKREVYEETGLRVTKIKPDIHTPIHTSRGDQVFAFQPFCCQVELKGKPRLGVVFICEVEEATPKPREREVKEISWVKKSELRQLFEQFPEKFFTFQLAALDYYLNHTMKLITDH
jgi:8-oxo-dGTP pyrophosphatase MutT (NUDIX family)